MKQRFAGLLYAYMYDSFCSFVVVVLNEHFLYKSMAYDQTDTSI